MNDDAHPWIDEIADWRAGLLADRDATRVATHVGACADCTRAVGALADVDALLADEAAQTIDMPDDVLRAIDEAIGIAALERAGVASLDSKRRDHDRRWSWRQRGVRSLTAAAAVLVVGAIGYGLDRSDSDSSGSASAGSVATGARTVPGLPKASPSARSGLNIPVVTKRTVDFAAGQASSDAMVTEGAQHPNVSCPNLSSLRALHPSLSRWLVIEWLNKGHERRAVTAVNASADAKAPAITVYPCSGALSPLYRGH